MVYSLPGGQTLRFTEYASSTVIPVPEGTGVSYAQISDGVIALRLETGQGVTLVWDCAGQTLCLSAADADSAMQIAQSVKKISGE